MSKLTVPLAVSGSVRHNLSATELIEIAVRRGEGRLAATGAFVALTGIHTGRSPNDKFTVRDGTTDATVWWDNNKPLSPAHFDALYGDFLAHARDRELFVHDLNAGADPAQRLRVRVFTEYAWHGAFIRYLLREPGERELAGFEPDVTIVNLPSFKANAARHGGRAGSETMIAVDFDRRIVLIAGSEYAGETKKSVFTFLNYLLPARGVMPMHCSANVSRSGESAVFFGLSGTGKTTLSADPNRTLLGDDEHGWSETGIFNFEGGCYAKTIRLSQEAEPQIWAASNRFGTVLENVVLKSDRMPDFNDGRLTENTRAAYPLSFIGNASSTGVAGHPRNIVMLTADAFGVMPPIARLTPTQAMYHFLSGYTAKVAGTEKGMKGNEATATFSTCFGAPFMPRHPSVYGNMLRDLIARHKVDCWLVNTGWTGGAYGVGMRMPIKATRALLDAALSGALKSAPMRVDPLFGFEVPLRLAGVEPKILTPRETWADGAAYDAQATRLVDMFNKNFERFEAHVDAEVRASAPQKKAA